MFYCKLFVFILAELDAEEPDIVYKVRQKITTLSSCFAQLTHKAQTIFQNSAKIEVRFHVKGQTLLLPLTYVVCQYFKFIEYLD